MDAATGRYHLFIWLRIRWGFPPPLPALQSVSSARVGILLRIHQRSFQDPFLDSWVVCFFCYDFIFLSLWSIKVTVMDFLQIIFLRNPIWDVFLFFLVWEILRYPARWPWRVSSGLNRWSSMILFSFCVLGQRSYSCLREGRPRIL